MAVEAGGICTFNIQHGFVEGLIRGYRSGFLDDVDYHHITQCETLEGEDSLFPSPPPNFLYLYVVLMCYL